MSIEDDSEQVSNQKPWYRLLHNPPPFRPTKRIYSNAEDAPNFRTLACFPWGRDSINLLFNAQYTERPHSQVWATMVARYWDAVAVAAEHSVWIFFTHHPKRKPVRINLPKEPPEKLIAADRICLAWAICNTTLSQPLLIISRGSLVYVYNVELEDICSYLRGHGGAITSIAVHPRYPDLFCTTSRDHSARIYNLRLPPVQAPNNPHWPPMPKQTPSRAGPAHGLHMNQPEGSGLGRCIIVLMGGRSGGHNAAVLGAAFHEDLPIIATCGMDRAVKIWHIRTNEAGDRMLREDKPLFSSTRIHKGRVLSVSWIGSDATLISHCAPAIMRKDSESDDIETYLEAGTVVVWRWLGMDRFFPAKYYHLQQQGIRQTVLRGCSSDYQESSSFKVLTAYAFRDMPDQYTVPRGVLYQSPYHDPLFLSIYPEDDHFLITNIALMKPRQIPSFDEMFAGILNTNVAPAAANEADETDGLTAMAERMQIASTWKLPDYQPPLLSSASWKFDLHKDRDEEARINCAAVIAGGRLMVGAGTRGNLWVWALDNPDL